MSKKVWEALLDIWERSGGPRRCPLVIGRPTRMSRRGREALPDGREVLPDVRSGQDASHMSGSVREAFPDVWEWSGGPPGCPGVVGMHSWMSRSGREAFPDVCKWLVRPPVCPRLVGRAYLMSVSGQEALPDVREWS